MTRKLRYDHKEESLLESVIHLTSLRERESLEISLVTTLNWIIKLRKIVLHRILYRQGIQMVAPEIILDKGQLVVNFEEYDDEAISRLDSWPAFIDCQTKRKEVLISCPSSGADCHAHIYPVFGNRDIIIGFFEVTCKHFDDISHKLITGFLNIYHNYLSIIEDSQRDTLTGLLNRKTFDNNIAKIIETQYEGDNVKRLGKNNPRRRKGSEESNYWLAVMDIDFFKRINDQFGHLYGDEVLLLLAQIMEKTFRQQDKLFRFGGEEFIVVLAQSSPEAARNTFERFRMNIENYDFPQVGKVTISIGFVNISHNEIPSTFIGHADEALYYAKHNGRNQVCSYEQLVREGKLGTVRRTNKIELF